MTTIDTELTLEDVSSISARYPFNIAPANLEGICHNDNCAGVVASGLLSDYVEKAMSEGISAEMIVYRVFEFAECLTMSTMTESPPEALETTAKLFAGFVKDIREDSKEYKRPSVYAEAK